MEELELAWAAGFFDGEGCSNTCLHQGRYPHFQVSVNQLDPRPLHRFRDAVDCGKVLGPYESQKGQVHWGVYDRTAWSAIQKLWPYLSEPKREQAQRRWDEYLERRAALEAEMAAA